MKQLNIFSESERTPRGDLAKARSQFYSDPRVKKISPQLVNKKSCPKCGSVLSEARERSADRGRCFDSHAGQAFLAGGVSQ